MDEKKKKKGCVVTRARGGAGGAEDAPVVWCGSVGDRSVSRTRCVQCVGGVRVTKGNIEEIYVFGGRRDHSGWSDGVPSPSYFELVSCSNRTYILWPEVSERTKLGSCTIVCQ